MEIAECRARTLEVVAKAREVLGQPYPDIFLGRQHDEPRSHATSRVRPASMRDMQAHLKTLRAQIVECERLERESKRSVKRDIFKRLAAHYRVLANELQRAIAQTDENQQ
jgi:hypothetical protein